MTRSETAQRVAEQLGLKMENVYLAQDPNANIIPMRVWKHLLDLEEEVERLRKAQAIAAEQAEDEALWANPLSIVEAYTQQELRRLTEAIEGKSQHQCAMEALGLRKKLEAKS